MNYRIQLHGQPEMFIEAQRLWIEPNRWGGINTVRMYIHETIWTGLHHLGAYHAKPTWYLTIQLCNIQAIQSRNTLNEDNEDWKLIFQSLPPTNDKFYDYWHKKARELRKVLR